MTYRRLALLLSLGALAACGSHDANGKASDSAIAAATAAPPPPPAVAHVMAFDLGRGVDTATQRLVGSTATTFTPADTIYLAIRTQFAPAAAALSARLLAGKSTVDSIGVVGGSPNASQIAATSARFVPKAKGWAVGKYQVEVFLNGVSQGLQAFDIVK